MMLHSSLEGKMLIDNFRGCSRELFYLESVEYHNIDDLTTAEYTVLYADIWVTANSQEPAKRNAELGKDGWAVIQCDKYILEYSDFISLLTEDKEYFVDGDELLQSFVTEMRVPDNVLQYYEGVASCADSVYVLHLFTRDNPSISKMESDRYCIVIKVGMGIIMCHYCKIFSELGGEIEYVGVKRLPWYGKRKCTNISKVNSNLQADVCYFFAGVASIEIGDRYHVRCFNKLGGECFKDYYLTKDEVFEFICSHRDEFIDSEMVIQGIKSGDSLYNEVGAWEQDDIIRVISISEDTRNGGFNFSVIETVEKWLDGMMSVKEQKLRDVYFPEAHYILNKYISNTILSSAPYLSEEGNRFTSSFLYSLRDAATMYGILDKSKSKISNDLYLTYINGVFQPMMWVSSFLAGNVVVPRQVRILEARYTLSGIGCIDLSRCSLLEATDIHISKFMYGSEDADSYAECRIIYPSILAGSRHELSVSGVSKLIIKNQPVYENIHIYGLETFSLVSDNLMDIFRNPRYYATHSEEFNEAIVKLNGSDFQQTSFDIGSGYLHAGVLSLTGVYLESRILNCYASKLVVSLTDVTRINANFDKLKGINDCDILCCQELEEVYLDIDELNLHSLWRMCRYCDKVTTFVVTVHKRAFVGLQCEEFFEHIPIQHLPKLTRFELVFDEDVVLDDMAQEVLEDGRVLIDGKTVRLADLVAHNSKSGGEL